jgi:pimeloyl-ACP methyl ester carboxylesterase
LDLQRRLVRTTPLLRLPSLGPCACLAAAVAATAPAQEPAERAARELPSAPEHVRGQPYSRYTTGDALGRRIVFYLSEEPDGSPPMPLVAYVHGSGAQSHFADDGGRLVGQNGHSTIADVVRGRARLLIVEKPGVTFLDAPAEAGGAAHASPEFRREHTRERWTAAVAAALAAARALPQVGKGPVLVAGHSEGGLVAAGLAAELPFVTHVAVLAGGGPTQLFDLLTLARRGTFFRDVSDDPDRRVEHVVAAWRRIQADPDSADQLFFGHPYRRWSSFLRTSTLEQLLATKARIFATQGAEDAAVALESFEALRAGLLAGGATAVFDLVPGVDHSFARSRGDGWAEVWQRVVAWFLAQ